MTRSQIEYIIAVDRYKSFGRAADACFVTQSTLSAMVAKFEQQSGVVLFNRKTRPISITPKGAQILRAIKSVSREFTLLDETIHEMNGKEVGSLNLACIPTVAPYLYPLILDELSRDFNDVQFSIHELTTERIIEEIVAGNRLWLMEEGHCLRNQVGKICELRQQTKINGNITYSCGTIFTLIEMVKQNKGITLLPRLAIQNSAHMLDEKLHDFKEANPIRKVGMVTHRNFTKIKMLSRLEDTIVKAVHASLPDLNTLNKSLVVNPF